MGLTDQELAALAAVPSTGDWATAVLAAALPIGTPGEDWAHAPASIQRIARASFGVYPGEGRDSFSISLQRANRCPQLAATEAYVLAHNDVDSNGIAFAVAWEDRDSRPTVHRVDLEDGASKPEGDLERWCAQLISDSRCKEEGFLNPYALYLYDDALAALEPLLAKLRDLRGALLRDLDGAIADKEAEIQRREAAGDNADPAYETWMELSEKRASLQRNPFL